MIMSPRARDSSLCTFNDQEILTGGTKTASGKERFSTCLWFYFIMRIFEGFNPCELLEKEAGMLNRK